MKIFEVKIKATKEVIKAQLLDDGNYWDHDASGASQMPTAKKANKKLFEAKELTIIKEIE